MSRMIFVNLPVKDLSRSMEFFKSLGYSFNPRFTDETAACMVISDQIFAMLITEPRFREFTPKALCDAHTTTEVLIALSCDSREHVDEMIEKVLAGGGQTIGETKDYGFMYYRPYQDLDGHIWELMYMDPAAAGE